MNKIDFVIAWVDGNDPVWREEKAKYQGVSAADSRNIRYREWDLLRYWFRGVEKYAPWVNRIHFITWGHVPAWLDTTNPKLHIVRHEDYIPAQYLPTFSSHPIELNMHRIPGLSEQFVYFNDDFFLTAPVKPEDFFVNGLPCDSLEERPLRMTRREIMNRVNANDVIFANLHFHKKECRRANRKKWYSLRTPKVAVKNLLLGTVSRDVFYGLNYHHLPQAYRKSTLEAVWEMEPGWLSETCAHKFRTGEDVSQCVFKYYQLATGQFQPYNKPRYGFWYRGGRDYNGAAKAIRERRYKFICYNDSDEVEFDTAQPIIKAAFESVLPERSSFEKDLV